MRDYYEIPEIKLDAGSLTFEIEVNDEAATLIVTGEEDRIAAGLDEGDLYYLTTCLVEDWRFKKPKSRSARHQQSFVRHMRLVTNGRLVELAIRPTGKGAKLIVSEFDGATVYVQLKADVSDSQLSSLRDWGRQAVGPAVRRYMRVAVEKIEAKQRD